MKKIIVYGLSIISLFGFSASLRAELSNLNLPDFMGNMINQDLSQNLLDKIFFINPNQLDQQLAKSKKNSPFYIIHHSKKSFLNKIIFITLKSPQWEHLQLKNKIYSIIEFKKYITQKATIQIEKVDLKRDTVKISVPELEAYLSNWTDQYLKLNEREKVQFLEDAILVAKELSFSHGSNYLYLLMELVVLKAYLTDSIKF